MEYSNRPPRGRSKRPTRSEIDTAWQHIREAAAAGNLQACEIVIRLADNNVPRCEDEESAELLGAAALAAAGRRDHLVGKSSVYVQAVEELAAALTKRIGELE